MNTRLFATLAAALALAAPAILAHPGHVYTRDVFGPGALDVSGAGGAGAVYCNPDLPGHVVTQASCATGGLGGAIIDVSDLNADRVPPGPFLMAGTCTVTQAAALGPASSGDFSFTCGVDRDNDFTVSSVDLDSSSARGFDDQFVGGSVAAFGSRTVAVCFEADLGGEFDDVWVFIEENVPSASVAAGSFHVELELAVVSGCSVAGDNRTFFGPDP